MPTNASERITNAFKRLFGIFEIPMTDATAMSGRTGIMNLVSLSIIKVKTALGIAKETKRRTRFLLWDLSE